MNDPMLTQAVEAKLAHRDIRATSSRILVLRTLMTQESALALSDLEAILPTLDKSTLFLDIAESAHIESERSVKLEGVSSCGHFWIAKGDVDFFAQLVDEDASGARFWRAKP